MTTTHDHAREMLDYSLKGGEWDEMPMATFLWEDPADANKTVSLLCVIADGHPAEFLEKFSLALGLYEIGKKAGREMPEPPPGVKDMPTTRPVGIVMFSEGWALKAPTEEGREYIENGGQISEHPDRVEVKMVTSYDGETMRMIQHARDGEERQREDEDAEVTGRVPDALRTMLAALNLRWVMEQ